MQNSWDWSNLLAQWNRFILNYDWNVTFPPELAKSQWLGRPGATITQISQLEERLKVSLPSSYKTFLMFTNGWQWRLTPEIYSLLSTDNVTTFSDRYPHWLAVWLENTSTEDEYITDEIYRNNPRDSVTFRARYLKNSLVISDVGDDAILLLNPNIIQPNGEWEAWLFANWLPGADRWPSFWDLMQSLYQEFVE